MTPNGKYRFAIVFVIHIQCFALSADLGLRTVDFSTDPRWEGYRNRLITDRVSMTQQDFGYSDTHFAGGAKSGEIGGWIQRSVTMARYGVSLKRIYTMADRLEMTGRFAVLHDDGSTGVLVGWYHDSSDGWRTPNSIALRLDGNGGKYWIFYEYGTQSRYTGGGGAFKGQRYQTTPTQPFKADGTPHDFRLLYDPNANNGIGKATFQVDDRVYELDVRERDRKDGMLLNRFGIWNQNSSGGRMQVFFDDLTVNGLPFTFDQDPQWEGENNRATYRDLFIRPFHNFGYSKTAHINAQTGEIGGVMWRDEKPAFYADRVGPFTMDDSLHASGKFAFHKAGADSALYIGWFNARAKRSKNTPENEQHQTNYLGILLEGPSRVGHYFRPGYRTRSGQGRHLDQGPVLLPNGVVHNWSIDYDPNKAGGRGQITVRVDGNVQTMDLQEGTRAEGATFDRFGLFNMQTGGWHVLGYFDDLTYSATRPTK